MFHKCSKDLNQKIGLGTCYPALGGFFSVPWMSGTENSGCGNIERVFSGVPAPAEKPFREKLLSVKVELRFQII